MKNPIDKMIKVMSLGVGLVSIIVALVLHFV